MNGRRIAVVGGGLSGLAAAYALERRGANVVVFEALDRLGGKACTERVDGVDVDPGAQLFGSMYDRFLGLVREVGLGEKLVKVPGRDALWRDGRAHEVVYGSVASMAASGGLPFVTKMRMGATYVPFLSRRSEGLDIHAPEAAAASGLDEESIEQWGEREIDRSFVDYLVYPQLGAYYGATPGETSAGFYHILAKHGLDVSLYGVTGGVGQVSERIAGRLRETGGEVRTGEAVRRIEVASERVTIETAAGEEIFYGAVAAIPAPQLLPLLTGEPPELRRWLEGVRYRPALTLTLLLDGGPGVRYFGLSFPRGTNRYVLAAAVQENKGAGVADTQRTSIVLFPTPEAAPQLVGEDERTVLNRMLPEIALALPGVEERVRAVHVERWPVGTPTMYPGYLKQLGRFRSMDLEGSLPLAVAGDYLYGPSVESAVVSGMDAARRLEARVGGGGQGGKAGQRDHN